MFNVLIVDDDQIVLECLNKFVNWTSLGFSVVGTALSVADAVNIIETEYVDVILTDIAMPGRDGLELVREAMKINPYIKTIILSSYIEFNYAKEAMKLGSFDYLTKPIDFDELKDIFNKLKAILDNELLEKRKQTEFRKAIKVQFLNNLVNGFFQNIEKIEKKAFELEFGINSGDFCLIRLLIEGALNRIDAISQDEYNKSKLEISYKANEILNKFGKAYLFDNNSKEIAILFYPSDISVFTDTLEKFSECMSLNIKLNLYVGIGGIYHSLLDASKSFFEAGKALEYRFVKKENYLYFKHISEFFKGRSVITSEVEEKIYEYLLNRDSDGFEEYIFNIINDLFRIDEANKGVLYEACIEILLIVNKYLMNYKSEDKGLKQNDYTTIRALLKTENYEEIKIFVSEYLKESMLIINSNQEKPMGVAIESVIKYINEHYNENITLQKLSEIAYLHPIYLCKLFKERTGENFMDYLMKVRIEQAKRLLGNVSLRIYDICEMVGYDSPQYFSKIFKDTAGLSPKDYRKKCHAI